MLKLVVYFTLQETKLGVKRHLWFKSVGRTLRHHQAEGKSIFKYHIYPRMSDCFLFSKIVILRLHILAHSVI